MSQYPHYPQKESLEPPSWSQPAAAEPDPISAPLPMPAWSRTDEAGGPSAAAYPDPSSFTPADAPEASSPGPAAGDPNPCPEPSEPLLRQMERMFQAQTSQFQQLSEQMQLLERKVGSLERSLQSEQEVQLLRQQTEALRTAVESLQTQSTETAQQTSAIRTSMDALTARNTDVLRQTMDFTNTSSRRWTKELEEYRALFRDTVYDDICKRIGEIYLEIMKHSSRKNDPALTDSLSFCALEPLQELLEEYGVSIQVTPAGEKRSFRRTKAKGQVPTGDPEKDSTVSRSIWPGFMRGSIVLIPEVVESCVYQEGYRDPAAEEESLREPPVSDSEALPPEPVPESERTFSGLSPESMQAGSSLSSASDPEAGSPASSADESAAQESVFPGSNVPETNNTAQEEPENV